MMLVGRLRVTEPIKQPTGTTPQPQPVQMALAGKCADSPNTVLHWEEVLDFFGGFQRIGRIRLRELQVTMSLWRLLSFTWQSVRGALI
jgi:hypothetical protein